MKYLILTVALFSVSACVDQLDPTKTKIACIDGILHEETSPDSGVYVPVYEYSEGVKQDPKVCKTLRNSGNIASNEQPVESPIETESY